MYGVKEHKAFIVSVVAYLRPNRNLPLNLNSAIHNWVVKITGVNFMRKLWFARKALHIFLTISNVEILIYRSESATELTTFNNSISRKRRKVGGKL